MYALCIVSISSLLLALLLTPVCRDVFGRMGAVDYPDGGRHLHVHPRPRIGGIPIFAAYLGAVLLLLVLPFNSRTLFVQGLPVAVRVLPSTALVFAIGLLDDLIGLKPWQKVAGQVIASCLAYSAGVQVAAVAGWTVPPWLNLPLTVFWLVGCSNAFNLIDGVDGLATGAGLIATVTILIGALLNGNVALALATAPLAGALLGFLRYNFNPASIFLGDSGSLTIGFLLGSFGVLWGQKSATVLGMTAPMIALAVPLVDTAVAIARRILRQQPIMLADTSHIHHRLLARGFTQRRVALLLYGACGVAAALSLLFSVAQNQYKAVVLIAFCAAAGIGVQNLGYVEFGVAGRMFARGAFGKHLNNQITLSAMEDALAAAQTPDECWRAICDACLKFGFSHADLRINGHCFSQTWLEPMGDPVWNLEIPLPNGRLLLTRSLSEPDAPTVLAPLAKALHRALTRASDRRAAGGKDQSASAAA